MDTGGCRDGISTGLGVTLIAQVRKHESLGVGQHNELEHVWGLHMILGYVKTRVAV